MKLSPLENVHKCILCIIIYSWLNFSYLIETYEVFNNDLIISNTWNVSEVN